MNRWCVIEQFATFEKVRFYTVRFEDEEISETDKFFSTFGNDANMREDLDILLGFLRRMGTVFGAKIGFFRHEGEAEALPPKAKVVRQYGLVTFVEFDFRLYCMRLSDNVVILFNGGIKTTYTNQEDPQLMSVFRMAKTFSRRINEKIIDKSFRLSGKEIIADELDFEY
jgi:hypothetical protein